MANTNDVYCGNCQKWVNKMKIAERELDDLKKLAGKYRREVNKNCCVVSNANLFYELDRKLLQAVTLANKDSKEDDNGTKTMSVLR